MIKDKLKKKLINALKKINVGVDEKLIDLQPPNLLSFGDYSTSIALKLAKNLKQNPLNIGKKIINNLAKDELIEKVDLIKPGFINFWLSKKTLFSNLYQQANNIFLFSSFSFGPNKKILIEYAQPNTHKLFHIGHLRNITLGEALARIFEVLGYKIIRTNYQGDIGLHIAKCLWAIKKEQEKNKNILDNFKTISQKIEFIGKMYTKGTKAYEDNPKAKEEIIEINKQIYNQDEKILSLWQITRKWSLDYFAEIYQKLDTTFDRLYFESEMAKRAIDICHDALKKGILEKSQGAIVFNGKKYGLDTRVFINSLGYPTYEGKELALAEKEFSDFGEIDKNIHTVTPEQTSFFKVTFKVEELIDEKKYKDKQYHLAYEWVKLKTGKMASREGNIIETNWLINEIKKKIIQDFNSDEKTAETLAISSAKYSFLKNSPQTVIYFDIDESIAVDGNSAPYLIYTYVRCQSVFNKSQELKVKSQKLKSKIENEELLLIRKLYHFPDVVLRAAQQLSPNLIASYLYEVASVYNLFYQKNPILKANEETRNLRLAITQATANVIKKGLYLLGIKTVEKM